MKTNHLRKFTHLLTTTFVLPVMLFCLLSFTVRDDDISRNRQGAGSTDNGSLNTSHDLTTNFNIVMSEKALVAKGEKEASSCV